MLTNSKGQDQGHADFDNDYLGNGDRCGKNDYCYQITSHVWPFDCDVYIWPLPILMVNVKIMHISPV